MEILNSIEYVFESTTRNCTKCNIEYNGQHTVCQKCHIEPVVKKDEDDAYSNAYSNAYPDDYNAETFFLRNQQQKNVLSVISIMVM